MQGTCTHFDCNLEQVQAWLETLFLDKPIPAFEINSKTIGILNGLVDINEKKDRDIKILIEDLAQKKDEYHSEGRPVFPGNLIDV